MDMLEEIMIEDDLDVIRMLEYGFPRKIYNRSDYFDEMDQLTFYKRFRLRKSTVEMILEQIEENLTSRTDRNNKVSPMNQLLAALRFYACGNHQDSIGDFIGTHQCTISRVIKAVNESIASLRPIYITMPDMRETQKIHAEFYRISRFPSVLGCIDGTHIKIQSPGGEDAEIYRNRKSFFSINVQTLCDSSLKIRDIVVRWPGSVHDLTIFNNSRLRARIEANDFPGSYFLGDSGYVDRPYLMTPHPNPVTRPQQLFNESLIRTRNCVERQIGVWKRRFLCLLYGLRCRMDTNLAIIVATSVLHNIAIEQNEGNPPTPEDVDALFIDYLVELGNIPIPAVELNVNRRISHRENLINQFFANL